MSSTLPGERCFCRTIILVGLFLPLSRLLVGLALVEMLLKASPKRERRFLDFFKADVGSELVVIV